MAARIVPAPRRSTTPQNIRRERGPLTAADTFTLSDDVLLFDTTAGDLVANLPLAADVPPGTRFTAVVYAGGNNITLTRAGADLIEGAATLAVTPTIRVTALESDGVSAWTRVEGGFWA